METREYTVYKFNELPEEAQEKALENLYDINVHHDWWDFIYADAETIGLRITAFDIDRGSYLEADELEGAQDIAKKILKEHGEKCDTHQTAKNFLDEVKPFEYLTDDDDEKNDGDADKLEELETEFLRAIKEDFLSILRQEYEYRTGEEAIKETIEANDYDFTADGKID
jgi:hypothetical protein